MPLIATNQREINGATLAPDSVAQEWSERFLTDWLTDPNTDESDAVVELSSDLRHLAELARRGAFDGIDPSADEWTSYLANSECRYRQTANLLKVLYQLHAGDWKRQEKHFDNASCIRIREKLGHSYATQSARIEFALTEIRAALLPPDPTFDAAVYSDTAFTALGAFYATLSEAISAYDGAERTASVEFHDELFNSWLEAHSKSRSGRRTTNVVELPEFLRFFSDPIHAGVIRGLAHIKEWEAVDTLKYGYRVQYAKASIVVGLPNSHRVEQLYQALCEAGPKVFKVHYGLWTRYYEAKDAGDSGAILSIPQCCHDLGFTRSQNGGYRREHKVLIATLMDSFAHLELRVERTFTSNKTRKVVQFGGRVWTHTWRKEKEFSDAVEALPRPEHSNQSEFARVILLPKGQAQEWEKTQYLFQPGPLFNHPDWKKHYRNVAKIGSGLLKLRNDKDQWAISIAAYLGTVIRSHKYRPRRLFIRTILNRANIISTPGYRGRPDSNRARFYDALEKLKSVGVIRDYRTVDFDDTDIDVTDEDALDAQSAKSEWPEGDWRNYRVDIIFPFESDEKRIQERTVEAIRKEEKRAKKADVKQTNKIP